MSLSWQTWMILTRKSLLVDIFLNRTLSKSLALCEFASVNFESCRKMKMSGNERKNNTIFLTTYDISSIKRAARNFLIVVMQINCKEMYKKVCCTWKVFFWFLRPIDFFCRCHCCRRLTLHVILFSVWVSHKYTLY